MTSRAQPAADASRQPCVLLVDDDEVNLLMTSMALRDRGFAIVEACDGAQALQALAAHKPDIVVLDAQMPVLDGFETCRVLRQRADLEHLPVLMLTGLDDDESISRAYQAGATDFFVKAPNWSLLTERLNFLLRSSRTRLELERSKARLARAQDLARMGSIEWHRDSGELVVPVETLRVLGLPAGVRPTLRRLLRRVSPAERRGVLRQWAEATQHAGVFVCDLNIEPFDHMRRVVHVEAEPEFDEAGRCTSYTGVAQDVTERRLAEDRIRHLANFDTLTGLPNRHQLIYRAERALEQARRLGHGFALLLIDLDRFKNVNDRLGHGSGDEMLRQVAQRLRSCVRHVDQLHEGTLEVAGVRSHRGLEAMGRLGGDEFVALLPEVADEAEAQGVADRVLASMGDPLIVAGQECFVSASIGIALFPRDGETVVDLMRNADVAMYSVKAHGRNAAAVYSPALSVGAGRELLERETALHKAIERDELVLHYQPQVDVRSGTLVGCEALMRWRHEDRLVPPNEFIPLAEETGLIVPMSEWALREAARQARLWRDGFGFDKSISVNLPSLMFSRSGLVDRIHEVVAAHGISYSMLKVEITETGLMQDLQGVMPTLHKLKEIGVDISIDDFGTGYSSLSYLVTLPIAEVKIDRAFVRDLGAKPQSAAVVQAVTSLAKALGLRVVAEGTEMLRQMEALQHLGCSVMQGYLFCRPVDPDEFQRWWRSARLPRSSSAAIVPLGRGPRRG